MTTNVTCPPALSPASGDDTGCVRVLLAEDDPALTRSIVRVLKGVGCAVDTAAEGNRAIEAILQKSYDVVLSDIQMPGMTGIELLHVMRAHDLEVPVVLMTADPRVDTAAAAVEYGAVRYLVKPVTAEVLCSTVQRAAKQSRAARSHRAPPRTDVASAPAPRTLPHASHADFDRALAGMWITWQPIVSARRGIFGYEALLRTGEASLAQPGALHEVAEELGRLPEVGRRMRALAAAAFVVAPPGALLFLELHTQDLLDPGLTSPDAPLTAIASRVVLEITDRSSLEHIGDRRDRIIALRELGFRVALDDLGGGYGGLGNIATLEPEFVKIDVGLVRDVHKSALRNKLIGAMTALCADLGTEVIAEGVELIEERDQILRLGCDLMQGQLFAAPGPLVQAAKG